MKTKHLTAALVSAALISVPATQVSADAGDFIAGAIIGGIVGANAKKKKRRTVYKSTRRRLPSTQEGRQTQAALNYFGFNAGTVDGQLGRKSRNAISNYQAHMGYPATGQLSDWERDFLFNSYDRAQAGGAVTMQTIASLPQGPRGLLHVYRDQMAGVGTTMAAQPNATVQPGAQTTVVVTAPAPAQPQAQTALPTLTATAPQEGALPNFLGNANSMSLASHCNGISLLTNSNGGFTTVSSMTDPHFTLNEQFCLARTYAIASGEEMSNRLGTFTPAQIATQCAAFGPAMKDQIAALSLQGRDDVIRATSNFILSTGMSPAEMSGTAKICLSSGYRTDDLDVALASSLMLVTLGEQVYAELLGHHLSQGFGVSKRPDLAQSWYSLSTQALEAGATPVFAPGQPERTMLLKAAASGLSGGDFLATPTPQPAATTTLPSFGTISE